jgi:hypothetical protein
VTVKPDVQEMIKKLDVTSNNVPRSNLLKQKRRKHNDDVASRAKSKTGHTDQNVGDRARSKLKAIFNSSCKKCTTSNF